MTHHVYFARVGAYVKIGHSGNVKNRLYGIKKGRGWRPDDLDVSAPVELLRTIPGCTLTDEAMIHYVFDADCAVGEWFHYSADLEERIQALNYQPDSEAYERFARSRRMLRRIRLAEKRRRAAA